MRLLCCGASGELGRSCFILDDGTSALMLDCGVKRVFGPGSEQWPRLPEGADRPGGLLSRLEAVLVTHAHEDHGAALPWLAALRQRAGVAGALPVYATRRTLELLPGYWRSWRAAALQGGLAEPYPAPAAGPDPASVGAAYGLDLRPLPQDGAPLALGPWMVRFGGAGHLPGSVWYMVEQGACRLIYSGDWNPASPLFAAPDFPEATVLLTDYHPRAPRTDDGVDACLAEASRRPVLLPLPRRGRGQELLARLAGSVPDTLPVYVDDAVADGLAQCLGEPFLRPSGRAGLMAALERLDSPDSPGGRWRRIKTFDDVPAEPGPCLILASDAMLSLGLAADLWQRVLAGGGLVAFTGHVSAGTPGQALLDDPAQAGAVRRLPLQIHPGLADIRAVLDAWGPAPAPRTVIFIHCNANDARQAADELRSPTVRTLAPQVGEVIELSQQD